MDSESFSVSLTPGQVLDDRYRIEGVIGRGGMAEVYAALDIRLERRVALKILSSELLHHRTARARMAREAVQLAKLRHPNVIEVHNVFDYQGLLVLDLELAEGGVLTSLIPHGGLPFEGALVRIGEILDGLAAIHRQGLVHRDIKPANILVSELGTLKIADLGVARDPDRQATKTGSRLGTPAYMSPEQIRGQKDVDHRSDIYSCGVLIYEMLTGAALFQADSEFDVMAAHVNKVPDLSVLQGRVPGAALGVLAKALEKRSEDRWQSVEDLRERLAHSAEPTTAPPEIEVESTPVADPGPPARSRLILAAMVPTFVFGGAALLLGMNLSDANTRAEQTSKRLETCTSEVTSTEASASSAKVAATRALVEAASAKNQASTTASDLNWCQSDRQRCKAEGAALMAKSLEAASGPSCTAPCESSAECPGVSMCNFSPRKGMKVCTPSRCKECWDRGKWCKSNTGDCSFSNCADGP